MANKPKVTVINMANMFAAHGNRRQPCMFHPHNGLVVEPTEENVKQACDVNHLVSLPWLNDSDTAKHQPLSDSHYSVTGSDTHSCLIDNLHEINVKKEEVLRRITIIKELKGKLNSQKHEQIHAFYDHDNRY